MQLLISIFIIGIFIAFIIVTTNNQDKIRSSLQENIRLSNIISKMNSNISSMESKYNSKIVNLEESIETLKQKNAELKSSNAELSKYNKKLEKYEKILDAQEEANKIREKINEKRKEADDYIQSAMRYYTETIRAADLEKTKLLNKTHEKLQKTLQLINLAEALENKLTKYKNQNAYFVSPYTLIDELANDLSYNEAGEQLKHARTHSRKMVEQNLAATCEYVEHSRKQMAINFVVDSFDSKVETILLKAKKDNYGVMEQKIKDAYYYVNDLGKPFRNAAITPEYLSTRLNELKWICRVQLLLQQIKDEEYAARERIREDIKAQKERDKVILKTQKEIISINENRETLKKEIQEASDKDREKLLNKLRQMEAKLKELTDINNRAVSMAEMVTEGNIYIISNIGSFGENVYKIGMTRRLIPEDRVHELSNASVPFPFDIHAIIHSKDAPALEAKLHKSFEMKRLNMVNLRKEFFQVSSLDIKEELEKQNIDVEWMELAKAEQYRESLIRKEALERGELTKSSLNDLWSRQTITIDDFDLEE